MTANVRIFVTEEAARDAADKLAEAGYRSQRVILAAGAADQEKASVRAAVDDGLLPSGHTAVCVENLRQSRSLVAVNAPFGSSQPAIDIMESCGAVDSHTLRSYVTGDPAPFSDMLGLPVLTRFVSMTELKKSSWAFSSMFGLGLLSRNPAPLSSLFKMKTLSSSKGPWTKSFGLPLLSKNPAPLSTMFGLKTVSAAPKRPWEWSFGYPLLSKNPAPLSSLLGIVTLIKGR